MPRTTIGDPEAFFGELAESDWPEVVGELYFEYHRGTYTSQARTKRASRRAERALHDAELLAAVAGEPAGLEEAWQTLLLNHFHDILPGSSIGEVHARAERDLAEVEAAAGAVRDRLLPRGVVNTIGVARREVVARGRELVMAEAPACGTGDVCFRSRNRRADGGRRRLHARQRDPPRGPRPRRHAALARRRRPRGDGGARQRARALRRPPDRLRGVGPRPVPPRDPRRLPARDVGARSCSHDPLRVEVAFERPIGERSRMRQTVRLDAEARRLEFHCAIDWQEDRKALKVRFPVDVLAPRATYEMQFGVVERPTHFSTRADAAQYEVPGHRFADLSEHGFGVALLSAATYGWSTLGGEMRMTLLRSPRWPDPDADRGSHELSFAVFPHAGGWQEAGRDRRGAALQRAAARG